MGLLTEGKPLKWTDSLPYIDYVKEHGIEEFLNIYNKYHNRCCDDFKWGDELEYLLIYAPSDPQQQQTASLCLRALEIQKDVTLRMQQELNDNIDDNDKVTIHPEYGSFMIEATPYIPYGDNIDNLLNVERNIYEKMRKSENLQVEEVNL